MVAGRGGLAYPKADSRLLPSLCGYIIIESDFGSGECISCEERGRRVEADELIRWVDDQLEELGTEHQASFSQKLIPGSKPILGVKIPELRKIAKVIAKEDWQGFVLRCPEKYFEQQSLKAFVIGYAKADLDTILSYADRFIPSIADWSVNDSFCQNFKIARKYPEKVWDWLMGYAKKNDEYSQRVVAVLAMSHFFVDDYIDRILELMNRLDFPGYYTRMGVAWCVATAFAKFPEKTMAFMKDNQLKDWTYNKSIQKMIESYRVTPEDKIILKTMKRR